jgi:small-conductance mechanosensitive channel
VKLGLLDYLGRVQFRPENFPDIWLPIVVASAALLIGQIVLYNVRSRQLHRHEPLRTMQEWLLWTGLIVFGLILAGAIFSFYFVFILSFIVIGLAVYLWIRFVRFPPYIAFYNDQLQRARFFSRSRFAHPDSTVRTKRARGRRRR